MGLGKAELDTEWLTATVAQRRDLESERLLRETQEQKEAREVRNLSLSLSTISFGISKPTQ